MFVLRALCLLGFAAALRRKVKRRSQSDSWSTQTNSNSGPCAAYFDHTMPVDIPLWCSGSASDLKFSAEARGSASPRLRLYIDGEGKGYRTFPIYPATRTWTVSHGSLSAGLHVVRYSGDRLDLKKVVVSGSGASCSFDTFAGYDEGSYTNTGMDVITRVFGPPDRNFSDLAKRGLHFVSETMGTSDDDSISSSAVGNGIWEWFYQYSARQDPSDTWLKRKREGAMYEESDILPYPNVSLEQFPGRFGENMEVCEPCNTLSNIAFHEAAVWMSCKGYPFPREDMATLMSGFNGLAAGSAFFHASATSTGQLTDRMTMQLLMLEVHQLMVKDILGRATGLTQGERDTILYLGKAGLATDHARTLTELFRGPYSHDKWNTAVRDIDFPSYTLSIVTTILTALEALDGNYPIPGISSLVNAALEAILDALGGSEVEFARDLYRPAIKKVFSSVKLCSDASSDVLSHMLSFVFTFVEAFVFQEMLVPVPDVIRDLFRFMDNLGLTSGMFSDMRETWDFYNGEKSMCASRSPHMAWHEKAAHGLVHISKVAEFMITKTSC